MDYLLLVDVITSAKITVAQFLALSTEVFFVLFYFFVVYIL